MNIGKTPSNELPGLLSDRDYYWLRLHNIDCITPRGRKVREALSFLCYSSRVHGLAVLIAIHGGHSEEATLKVS